MAVLTNDVLLEGIRKQHVFEWLGQPDNLHACFEGAFDQVSRKGNGEWEATLNLSPKNRTMGIVFQAADDSHGGRRVLLETTGKRTVGKLHFSLRTMKPSTNTLVTLHQDYDPGSMLGQVIMSMGLQDALDAGWKKVLDNMARAIPRG